MKKKTDYCDMCTKTHILLGDRATSPEEIEEAQNSLNAHLLKAQESRRIYNETKQNLPLDTVMLSFDYAENILLPHLNEQLAQFYFHSRRKIECFGITNEKTNEQLTYLTDECHKISKGPNAVLSMIYHYLQKYVPVNSKIIFYCDNSPAQNKNEITIAFMCYLVKILKTYQEIKLAFMISGHTKFAPDSHFGTIKKKIKETDCYSIKDLIGENRKG